MPLSQDDIDARLDQLVACCRREGIRMTRQRLEIYREVARTEAHPDADMVFLRVRERLPRVSLDTVYRTLASLERLGMIRKVSALHGAARYDANTHGHHHFICTRCGMVRDVTDAGSGILASNPEMCEWGRISAIHTDFLGICRACLAKSSSSRSPVAR